MLRRGEAAELTGCQGEMPRAFLSRDEKPRTRLGIARAVT
jgi:hypothetical protein